jgi:hypothetical protein
MSVGVNGDPLGGGIDPADREVHYQRSGSPGTMCGASIDTLTWDPVPDGSVLIVSCAECRRVLVGASPAESVRKVIEPRARRTEREHVTGDDDSGRGRLHRPAHLQLCLTCGELRGPYGGFDNLCDCDGREWDRQPQPRSGDLSDNVRLCRSCVGTLVGGSSRWSPYHCDQCMPAVQLWRKMAGRSVVPIGPHSLMNGVGVRVARRGARSHQMRTPTISPSSRNE